MKSLARCTAARVFFESARPLSSDVCVCVAQVDSMAMRLLPLTHGRTYMRFPAPQFRHATTTATSGLIGLLAWATLCVHIRSHPQPRCQNKLLGCQTMCAIR